MGVHSCGCLSATDIDTDGVTVQPGSRTGVQRLPSSPGFPVSRDATSIFSTAAGNYNASLTLLLLLRAAMDRDDHSMQSEFHPCMADYYVSKVYTQAHYFVRVYAQRMDRAACIRAVRYAKAMLGKAMM